MAVILPILNRVVAKSLILINYKLNFGVCSALGNSLQGNSKLLTKICLDNNGCLDLDFAKILTGLKHLDNIKSIVYRRNQFGVQSLEAIIPLLQRRKPYHVEELRLVSCKVD